MAKIGGWTGAGISLFLLGAALAWGRPVTSQATGSNPSTDTTNAQASAKSTATPDHAAAYYHFMLARRYQELVGAENRRDYIGKAISEYQQAIAADPDSLFLHVELADLYYRLGRTADAVRETEGVLQANPDDKDAHELLANIYLRTLSTSQPNKVAKDNLHKAIEQYEALVRLEPKNLNNYVMLGRLYRLNDQNAQAEAIFKRALGADPNSKPALTFLAQLYTDQRDYKSAIEALTKVPESQADSQTLGMLGLAYAQSHDYEHAVSTYERALSEDPENQEIRHYYAEALIATGKTDEARAELEKILKADPEDGAAHLRLGHLDRVEGHFDQARDELAKAKTLLPDNAEVVYEQVLLNDALGNDDQAITLLQGLLKDTEHANGQYTPAEANNRAIFLERLGLIYREQEKYDQALGAFRSIVALGQSQAPHGEALIAETLRLNRQPQKAVDEVDAALKTYPHDRSLIMLRASLVGEQGNVDEAVRSLQALLKDHPGDTEVGLAIAQVYSQAKRYHDAEKAVQAVLESSSKPEDQEAARFMLGSIYERQKQYDRAEEQFKQVLAADPLNGPAANYLGYMLADRGVRLEESVKYIQKALDLDPNNGAYLDSLGWAYYKMHRFDLAEGPLEKAARLITDDPTILEHLGNLHLELGKERLAEQEWERALKEWPKAAESDFDSSEASKLQKKLDELKTRLARKKGDSTPN